MANVSNNANDPFNARRFVTDFKTERVKLRRRYRRDKRFKAYTILALAVAATFLGVFLIDLIRRGSPALRQTEVHAEVTYSMSTVSDPITAFPEDIRDLVSYSRIRQVAREGQRAEISVEVDFNDQVKREPAAAIKTMTMKEDDFPPFMRDLAGVEIPSDHLLLMIDADGLELVRQTLADDPALAGTQQVMWLRGSEALQQFLTDSTGFDEQVKESAETLYSADKLRAEFNQADFGDGKTIEEWVLTEADVDQYMKGKYSELGLRATQFEELLAKIEMTAADQPTNEDILAAVTKLRQQQETEGVEKPITMPADSDLDKMLLGWNKRQTIERLRDEGQIRLVFNSYFFLNGDSKLPESAGMKSAIIGSTMVLLLVFVICVPTGVLTSIYLEEFAADNWLTQTIEVNINNLAAIPSILFGVLGLAAFINYAHMPRTSALVGGATLALMTLPIIIISARAALRAVPDSIRMAGVAMGATRWQVVVHHVLPAALSGIMTGAILGIAQAMGETAPLIIVGLVAFVPDAPQSPTDPTTVMPAQIYSWWEMPQRAFEERAALAIMVLLGVLFLLNGIALVIRARAEKTW